jgi:hypothetical protein
MRIWIRKRSKEGSRRENGRKEEEEGWLVVGLED